MIKMINKGTNFLTKEQQKKLDEVLKICNNAIEDQKNRERRKSSVFNHLGYGFDDYTEGRAVGAANLARRIKRIAFGEE
jgi:hypothetical protein